VKCRKHVEVRLTGLVMQREPALHRITRRINGDVALFANEQRGRFENTQGSPGITISLVRNEIHCLFVDTELEISELISDPRFSTTDSRLVHYSELKPILDRVLAEFTRPEVLRKMAKAAIPAGPVNTVAEVLEDPQIDAREMIQHLTHPEYGPIRVLGLPVKLSETPGGSECTILMCGTDQFGERTLRKRNRRKSIALLETLMTQCAPSPGTTVQTDYRFYPSCS